VWGATAAFWRQKIIGGALYALQRNKSFRVGVRRTACVVQYYFTVVGGASMKKKLPVCPNRAGVACRHFGHFVSATKHKGGY